MRKYVVWVLACCMIILASCADAGMGGEVLPRETAEGETETVAVPEEENALRISLWQLDPALEGKGHFTHEENKWGFYDPFWVPEDGGEARAVKEVFRREELVPGQTCTTMMGQPNLAFHIEWDGTIEVTYDYESERDTLRLVHHLGDWDAVDTVTATPPCTINVCPLGKFTALGDNLQLTYTLPDRDYTLRIKAYNLRGKLEATAEISLVALDDPSYPADQISDWFCGAAEPKTRFLAVTLVSLDYSGSFMEQ